MVGSFLWVIRCNTSRNVKQICRTYSQQSSRPRGDTIMTVRAASDDIRLARVEEKGRVAGGVVFDWFIIVACTWMLGGAYLDAWAHNHIPLETFFTPWHAVLYSGLLAVLTFHFGALIRNRLRGYSWPMPCRKVTGCQYWELSVLRWVALET